MITVAYDIERLHSEIVSFLESQTPEMTAETRAVQVGTQDPVYGVSNQACRGILGAVAQKINGLSLDSQATLLDHLANGRSHEEKSMVGLLLKMRPQLRAHLRPDHLEPWIHRFNGWAQIDALCQNVFTADEMLTDWPGWSGVLERFSRSEDERDQRAGLVLLVGPMRHRNDVRLLERAEASLRCALEFDTHLVQRAVSWLLREMIRIYGTAIERFITIHETELPASIIREVRRHLSLGAL